MACRSQILREVLNLPNGLTKLVEEGVFTSNCVAATRLNDQLGVVSIESNARSYQASFRGWRLPRMDLTDRASQTKMVNDHQILG